MRHFLCAFIALIIVGCASSQQSAQIETAVKLPKEHFKNTAVVKDDSLETVATISTINGFQEKRGLLGIVWDDNFLRAFIDKKSGKVTYQLYQVLRYQGEGWKFYEVANYETPSGPRSVPLISIGRDVNCSGSKYGGCLYTEQVAFDVDESLLKTISDKFVPGQMSGWKFKFKAKSGEEYTDGLLPAEAAGLLEKVAEYRIGNRLYVMR